MDLEERTLERLGDRCEECGAKLTVPELQAVLEQAQLFGRGGSPASSSG